MSLGPAGLLRAPRGRRFGKVAWHFKIGNHGRAPTLECAADREVEILRHRVAGPTAAGFDRGSAPDASRSVERDRQAGAETRFLFDGEMAVEEESLCARQPVGEAVRMSPPRLYKAQTLIGDER